MKDQTEKGWVRKNLTEIASISSGNSISAKDRAGKYSAANVVGRHFISTKDVSFDGNIFHKTDVAIPLKDQCNFRLAPKGSTLVCSEGGSAGRKVGLLEEDVHYGNKLFSITGNDDVLPEMVYYICQTDDFVEQFQDRKAGLIGGVSLSKFKTIEMPIPPLEEQRRIVAVLDEAFEGLARARALAEANLQNARELFDGQLSAIFKKIDTGQRKPLGDVCEFVRGPFGGSLKKAIFKPSGYAVYEQQHAIRGQFDDFRYFIDDAKFAEMMRFRVEAGDLIMSCSGTMGKVAIVSEGAPDGIINQALLKLRPSGNLRAEFLRRWMQSDDFQDQLSANTMGVAIKNVASVKTLKTLSAVVPSLEDQGNTVRKSEEAEQQFIVITRNYEAKIQELDNLRQSLLQKAFAAELT